MRFEERAQADQLKLEFGASAFPPISHDEALDALLDIIERHSGELMPSRVRVEGKRQVRYSRAGATKRFSERDLKHESWWVSLSREDKPEMLLWLHFNRTFDDGRLPFWMTLKVLPFDFYREPALAEDRAQRLVSLVRDVSRLMSAYHAYAHSDADVSMSQPVVLNRCEPRRVSAVYWLNVYGKEMVDEIGRERVLSTPAAHLEELPHGAVLLLSRPTPADFDSEEARLAQARALVHLDPSQPFDAVFATLRERSAAFVRVERDWDPDLTEILEYVLNYRLLRDRQRETARFNHLRPTVTEWLPLEKARRSDYVNVHAAIKEYGVYAELLQHAPWSWVEIPGLKSGGPPSLTALDCHFWQYEYGKDMKRENLEATLIPGVGSYLGELMVNELGGRWVPRQNRDEAYVVIGDRAWLPFLRARHCLGADRECVLNYSLTKFYREAERYARSLRGKF